MNDTLSQFAMAAMGAVPAILAAVLAITLHEAAHGFAALLLGDDTARRAGRLSLNPIRHIDRVGTILVPAALLLFQWLMRIQQPFLFGWAKPVPVDARRFRDPRRGMAWVASAGPAMNFVLAWIGALLMPAAAGPDGGSFEALDAAVATHPLIGLFLFYFILTNLVLGLFNLLPIPPLDGGRIAVGVLPLSLARRWAQLERAGLVIVLVVVLLLPRLTGFDPVGEALNTILPWAFRTVFWLGGHDVGDSSASVL